MLAGCVIQDEGGKILLLHRREGGKSQWEVPGGKIEEGEEPWQASVRETLEEIGVEPTIAMELGNREFRESAAVYRYYWFLATIDKTPAVKESKFDKLAYFSWHEMGIMREQLSPNARNLLQAYNDNKLPI